MKNRLFVILIGLLSIVARGESKELSSQAMMMFEIKSILETDNIKSQMTKAGNLTFVIKGNSYSLEIVEDNDNLFFARLSRLQKYSPDITKDAIDQFNQEINYKIIKVFGAKPGYYLRAEFLFAESAYFKLVFGRMLELMDKVNMEIKSRCPALTKRLAKEESFKISSFKLLAERMDSSLTLLPIISYSVPEDEDMKAYPICLRLYRNNLLLQNDESPNDYTYVDTLCSNYAHQKIVMRSWMDCPMSDSVSYRCELWRDDNCIAISTYKNK